MRDTAARKASILKAAVSSFVDFGFEDATLKAISQASGAAIGSIVHFFTDKPGLALAVRTEAAQGLAVVVTRALEGSGNAAPASIFAAITAYLEWAHSNPTDVLVLHRLRLIDGVDDQQARHGDIHQSLFTSLAIWAAPYIQTQVMRPMSPSGLFAIILAPVAFIALTSVNSGCHEANEPESTGWPTILTQAAVAALMRADRPAAPKIQRNSASKSRNAFEGQGLL